VPAAGRARHQQIERAEHDEDAGGQRYPPAARQAAATLPANPATEIMFGVTPMAASGETMGSVNLVETLCGTRVNDGK
jgi:hypothetical protein